MESTAPCVDVQRAKQRASRVHCNPKVLPAAAAADENAWPAAGVTSSTSTNWTPLTGDLAGFQRTEFVAACGGGKQTTSMNGPHSGRTLTKWKGNGNVAAEQPVGVETPQAGVAKTPPGMSIKDVRRMNRCGGDHDHLGRNEWSRYHHNHHQQPSDMNAGNPSNNNTPIGQFQSARFSSFKKAPSGNPHQHHGGGSRHHQAHHHQQHHGGHHNPIHVIGAARRCHRRRGFGAAAVEVIRNRTFTGANSPHHNTRSPKAKGRKQQGRPRHIKEQESHAGFSVPLPHLRLPQGGRQELTTPGDGEAATKFSTSGSELGSGVVGENTSSAFRLSIIAPFYECAVHQLITMCERRAAHVNEAVHGMSGNENLDNPHKTQPSSCLASIRSFDMPSSVNLKSLSAPLAKASLSQHALSTRTPFPCGEGLPQHEGGLIGTLESSNGTEFAQDEEERNEAKQMQSGVMASGGGLALASDGAQEQEASPTMVQQLLESIGLHVAYGDAAPMVLIGALVYISRITVQSPFEDVGVTSANWYRLITIAILIATKMYVDGSRRWNERISRATGLSLKEIQKLELDFLFLIDFALLIKEEEVETWAEWMDSVARKRGMSAQLHAFIFGKNSCPPSATTTPMSSLAGDDAFSRSLSHMPSGNLPSTPISLTPANMTPQISAHVSPGAMKSACVSQRLSMSFVLDLAEKHPRPTPQLHPSPSSLHACETPNPFFPSPLCASLEPRRTERLFSIVHAPGEPSTPLKLQQMSQLFNDATRSMPFTPPEQQTMSPIEFFKRSFRVEGACNTETPSAKARCGMDVSQKSAGRSEVRRLEFDVFDEEPTPPHRPMNILSPPERLNIALPPPRGEYSHFASLNKSSSSRDIPPTSGKTAAATAPQSLYSLIQTGEDKTVRGHASRGAVFGSAEARTLQAKVDTAAVTPHANTESEDDKVMHAISTVRGGLGTAPWCGRGTPLNVLGMATDGSGGTRIGEGDMYNKSTDVDNFYVSECEGEEEEDDHNEFEDDFEDDRDNAFLRRRPVLTHSPPA